MTWKKTFLPFISLAEAGTGIILQLAPALAVRALFGVDIASGGVIMSRIAGIAIIGLGVACWPSASPRQPIYGMSTYSILAMLYLIFVGITGTSGVLLWPAAVAHAGLVVLLIASARQQP